MFESRCLVFPFSGYWFSCIWGSHLRMWRYIFQIAHTSMFNLFGFQASHVSLPSRWFLDMFRYFGSQYSTCSISWSWEFRSRCSEFEMLTADSWQGKCKSTPRLARPLRWSWVILIIAVLFDFRGAYEVKETPLSCDHVVDTKMVSYSEGRPCLRNNKLHLRHGRKKEPRKFRCIVESWVCPNPFTVLNNTPRGGGNMLRLNEGL